MGHKWIPYLIQCLNSCCGGDHGPAGTGKGSFRESANHGGTSHEKKADGSVSDSIFAGMNMCGAACIAFALCWTAFLGMIFGFVYLFAPNLPTIDTIMAPLRFAAGGAQTALDMGGEAVAQTKRALDTMGPLLKGAFAMIYGSIFVGLLFALCCAPETTRL